MTMLESSLLQACILISILVATGTAVDVCDDGADLPPRVVSQLIVRSGIDFSDISAHPVLERPDILAKGIIVDVGANDGRNLACPSLRASGARVVSFEPQPHVAAQLYTRAKGIVAAEQRGSKSGVAELRVTAGMLPLYDDLASAARALTSDPHGGFVVIPGAAGEAVAAMPVFQAAGSGTKMVSLVPGNMPAKPRSSKGGLAREHDIPHKIADSPVFPLDAIFSSRSRMETGPGGLTSAPSPLGHLNISLLKIDAQGFELSVLKGASEILAEVGRVEAVQFEFVPHMLHNAAGKPYELDKLRAAIEVLDIMRNSGMACYQISKEAVPLSDHLYDFESFVVAHFREGCAVLGCSSEILCVPMCGRDASDPLAAKRVANHVFAVISADKNPHVTHRGYTKKQRQSQGR